MQFTRRIILTLLIIVLCSALAFASDDSPSPEQAPLEVESVPDPWLSLETKTQVLRATEKTITDVYNILNSGLMSGSTPKLDNLYTMVSDNLEFWVNSQKYSIADLQGMTWQIANSINNQLTSTNSILGNIYNENYTTNRKLEYVFSAIEDTINIKWYSFPSSYLGTKRTPDGVYLTSRSWGSDFYVYYDLQANYSNYPNITRFFVPLYANLNSFSGRPPLDLEFIYSNGSIARLSDFDYFLENTQSGSYIYLIDFGQRASGSFAIHVQSSTELVFREDFSGHVFYIPFDTLDYQIIKTAFYQAKSADSDQKSLDQLLQISAQLSSLAHSSQSGSEAAEALADYIVSPQKQAAEDASQQVINSTLNNFTGSGSGAAKSSDSNAMKDVSGSLQSGLNAGGSVSGATGVFNSSGDFWKWFSQENSNYINNPYPAPVVTPTRGLGDEIVDFLTPNSNELHDLLRQGGDQR